MSGGGYDTAGNVEETEVDEGRAQRRRQQQGHTVNLVHGPPVDVAQRSLLGGAGSDKVRSEGSSADGENGSAAGEGFEEARVALIAGSSVVLSRNGKVSSS